MTSDLTNFRTPSNEFLSYPTNKVVALLDDPDSVRRAIADLVRDGFDEDEIHVLSGSKGAARLDLDGRHHGFRARLYRWVERLSDTTDWLERHSLHLAGGGFGLTVPADKNRKAQAADILGRHGAHDSAYFGAVSWEVLDPLSAA
jgi:hypothetical protein